MMNKNNENFSGYKCKHLEKCDNPTCKCFQAKRCLNESCPCRQEGKCVRKECNCYAKDCECGCGSTKQTEPKSKCNYGGSTKQTEKESKCNCGCGNQEDDIIITIPSDDESSEMQNERRRADEMTTAAKRLQAEFDNYKKRTAAASATAREEGRKEVIEKLLPAVDALFQAEKLIKDESVLQGLRLISEKIDALLSSFCVTKIQSKGEEFDPEYHNAVMTVDQPNMSGKITEVLLDGYMISGKLLRHATVIIAK